VESVRLASPREFQSCPPPGPAYPALIGHWIAISEIPVTGPADRFCFPYLIQVIEVTKLYVGNLPFTATEDAVRTLFATHGAVEKVSLISDRDTGRPRGFAFVEMSNADASRAKQALNGTDFEGRTLKIDEAQERERSGSGGGRPRRY
jgi:RNA recognition motif. (a.k.a. RRM, RBD, or RNP domain)